jgi:hypothetical protein
MEQPPDLPQSAGVIVDDEVTAAPLWVRMLAGAADSIVAGLCSLAIIVVILIPYFYPETQTSIYEYAEQSRGSVAANTELARSLIEKPAMREMLFASQMILYRIFPILSNKRMDDERQLIRQKNISNYYRSTQSGGVIVCFDDLFTCLVENSFFTPPGSNTMDYLHLGICTEG